MNWRALALDYDGTLAYHGSVDAPTIEALERLKSSGRQLLMVTGREVTELLEVFPETVLFDLVVAENGPVLYEPKQRTYELLAQPPPPSFSRRLVERGVRPLAVGKVVVATWEPHQHTVLRVIRDLGLELEIVFNKGAVMVLPSGVNKATGLTAAARRLGVDLTQVVGMGDAENDHSFAAAAGFFAAVANAIPSLKERSDVVTQADHGAGVVEVVDQLIQSDLRGYRPNANRSVG